MTEFVFTRGTEAFIRKYYMSRRSVVVTGRLPPRLWRRLSRNSNLFGSWRQRNHTPSFQINPRKREFAFDVSLIDEPCKGMLLA
jgi:hypothetical protein